MSDAPPTGSAGEGTTPPDEARDPAEGGRETVDEELGKQKAAVDDAGEGTPGEGTPGEGSGARR